MFDLYGAWESTFSVFHYDTNSVLLSGISRNIVATDSTKYLKFFLWQLDSNLNPTIKVLFGQNNRDFNGSAILNDIMDSVKISAVLDGSPSVSDTSPHYYLLKTNHLGDTLNYLPIETPHSFYSSNWILNGDKIFIWGIDNFNPTLSSNSTMICVDLFGKMVWKKTYTKSYNVLDIKVTSDKNFLFGGSLVKGSLDSIILVGWYAKIDSLGNFIWEKLLDKKNEYEAPGVTVSKIKNHYYVAGYNDGSEIQFPYPVRDTSFLYMFEIDNLGNPMWYKRTYTSPWSKYIVAGDYKEKNGAMYAIGNLETTEGWAGTTKYLTLLKFDSTGNLLWQRFFKQWYRDNRPYSLTPVYDGFIICADGVDTTHSTGKTDAWVIKTDTNGCVIPGCHLKDGLVQLLNTEAFLSVYPNPSNNVINIAITDTRAKLAKVSVYDMLGNELHKIHISLEVDQCHIRTDKLVSGNYLIVIELSSGERAVKKILIQN